MTIQDILKEKRLLVDHELEKMIPVSQEFPVLNEAMRYSLLATGKRIRPVLALLVTELFIPLTPNIIRTACALEFLHTYTLIHDDLPCMDNDDLRRGRPTLHKVYGENIALLAGDALLTQTFEIIADNMGQNAEKAVKMIADLSLLAGSKGVIGGQVLDLLSENQDILPDVLERIHLNKTAKLIQASVHMGAHIGGANEKEWENLSQYGLKIGHAFQIADDILDETGDSGKMGKNTGQDLKQKKSTYPKLFGMERSREILSQKILQAVDLLSPFGSKAKPLILLAEFIKNREL